MTCKHENWEIVATISKQNFYTGRPPQVIQNPYHVWCKDCEKFVDLNTGKELQENELYNYVRISEISKNMKEELGLYEEKMSDYKEYEALMESMVVVYKTIDGKIYKDIYESENPKRELFQYKLEDGYIIILNYDRTEKVFGEIARYSKYRVIKIGLDCETEGLE